MKHRPGDAYPVWQGNTIIQWGRSTTGELYPPDEFVYGPLISRRAWTPDEDQVLADTMGLKNADVAALLSRTVHALTSRRALIGLSNPTKAGVNGWEKWTDEEIEFLMDAWGTHTAEQIARALGRTKSTVYAKHRRLVGGQQQGVQQAAGQGPRPGCGGSTPQALDPRGGRDDDEAPG